MVSFARPGHAPVRIPSPAWTYPVGGSTQDTATDYDDDLPDFSTREWVAKFNKAPVHPGEPIDLQSVRVTHGPDGVTRVSYKTLPDQRAVSGAAPGIPPTDPDKG